MAEQRIVFFYSDHLSKRRVAVCGLINAENKTINYGISICNPKDTFIKQHARKIAHGRALKNPIEVQTLDGELPSGKVFHLKASEISAAILSQYNKKKK